MPLFFSRGDHRLGLVSKVLAGVVALLGQLCACTTPGPVKRGPVNADEVLSGCTVEPMDKVVLYHCNAWTGHITDYPTLEADSALDSYALVRRSWATAQNLCFTREPWETPLAPVDDHVSARITLGHCSGEPKVTNEERVVALAASKHHGRLYGCRVDAPGPTGSDSCEERLLALEARLPVDVPLPTPAPQAVPTLIGEPLVVPEGCRADGEQSHLTCPDAELRWMLDSADKTHAWLDEQFRHFGGQDGLHVLTEDSPNCRIRGQVAQCRRVVAETTAGGQRVLFGGTSLIAGNNIAVACVFPAAPDQHAVCNHLFEIK